MHTWREVVETLLSAQPADQADLFRECSHLFRTELDGCPAAEYTITSLEAERHLTLPEKAEILYRALFHYERTRVRLATVPDPLPPLSNRFKDPLNSLGEACWAFRDLGADIDEQPCGELVHYLESDWFIRQISQDSPTMALRSDSGDSWRITFRGPRVNRQWKLLSAVKGLRNRVFSTLATWVDERERKGLHVPDEVRDLLGCPHLDQRELMELRFSETFARRGTFKKPTFADASAYPPFLPSEETHRYGTGRNIRDPQDDGGPELWHHASSDGLSGARIVGTTVQPLLPGTWADYVATCRAARKS